MTLKGNQTQPGSQPQAGSSSMADAYQNAAGQANAQAAPQQAQPQGAPVGGGNRITNISQLFRGRAPLSRDSAGRDLAELTRGLQKYYDDQKNEMNGADIRIVAVPRGSIISSTTNHSNKIGMILFIVAQGNRHAYHTLLLASDMPTSAPAFNNEIYGYQQQQQAQAPRTPAALADDALAEVIKERVGQIIQQGEIYSADWSEVPLSFKITDSYAIASLFLNALRACWTELEMKTPGFKYDSLSGLASSAGLLVNSIHFNQDQANPPVEMFDMTGLPIRGEVLTNFRSEQPRANIKDMTENTAGTMQLGQTMAYVTLNIDPVAARANRFAYQANPQNQQETQEYVAELTIAGMDMALTPDLGNVLLQLSTLFPVMDYNTRPWLRNFYPKHLQLNGGGGRGENFRPRDLGALNWDYGLKTPRPDGSGVLEVRPLPTNDPNAFTMDVFYQIAQSMIQPAIALGIDVPVVGADTWFLRVFAEASDVPQAAQAIIKAADALTDGRFSQIFNTKRDRLIVLPTTERVLNGYYTDSSGHFRDLREVDMLFLLNKKGHEDPTIGKQWAATFGGSTDAQLATRAKLIEDNVHGVVFTGISTHKTFHMDFISALDEAIGNTGFKPRVDIAQDNNRGQFRQAYGLSQTGALATNFVPTMYQNNPYGNPGSGGGYRGLAHIRSY